MAWSRGHIIGRGSYGTVGLAMINPNEQHTQPLVAAVKFAPYDLSKTLQHEKTVLDSLGDSPHIIKCLGEDVTIEEDVTHYNLFLEYATRGTLADQLENSPHGHLRELDVKHITRSLLRALIHLKNKGYVHCDVKPENILLMENGEVKLADFGTAKKVGEEVKELRGTPLYMAPEGIMRSEYEPPFDVWSLGCTIAKLVSGRHLWMNMKNWAPAAVMFNIGFKERLPEIPNEISEQGKDFLGKCLARDPKERWTAEMLLDHPFVCYGRSLLSSPFSGKLVEREVTARTVQAV
ncbi:Mitogen-activated protein kinase kinase kinase ANP1 [Acorus calamus]|uniref:Mitogen-activated protein kinase kinase kinase ANP1 n=1 Tax=Acorus calamus TaxID=4465 RepID=A0AAV9DCU9_ACOCL|nr:Mitogen-activated protein kinase kinase kinase ANP1 [Acorus calamus]